MSFAKFCQKNRDLEKVIIKYLSKLMRDGAENMKKLRLILLAMAGIIVLGYGRIYWQEQITQMTHKVEKPKEIMPQDPTLDTLEVNMEHTENLQQVNMEHTENLLEVDMAYTENLPPEVIDKIELAIENETPVQLALIARNDSEWAVGLREALLEVYGSELWNVQHVNYGDEIITDLLQNETLQNLEADVIVFEGPFLNNNLQGLAWEIALEQLEQLIDYWEDASVMIQPPNPIYQGIYFPSQVELYRTHMSEQQYLYLDHWSVWPDSNNEEILSFLDLDEAGNGRHVNEEGAELWQEYLINYFIAR